MALRIAVNGCGRIGRAVLRLAALGRLPEGVQLVAVNDPHDPEGLVHLLRYDSTFGPLQAAVALLAPDRLQLGTSEVCLTAHRNPADIPWKSLQVDLVLECTGRFLCKNTVAGHLQAGAKKVLLSAPAKGPVDATVVLGANDSHWQGGEVVSIGSCTTNAAAPILAALSARYTMQSAMLTTVHAVTNDQNILDNHHADWRRARSAMASIIPTKTGAAKALADIFPALRGRVDGYALRVPTHNVSSVELSLLCAETLTVEAVHHAIEAWHQHYPAVLKITDTPLVSTDYTGESASCVVDKAMTRLIGQQLRIFAWYDNEWGYANRLLDMAGLWAAQAVQPASCVQGDAV